MQAEARICSVGIPSLLGIIAFLAALCVGVADHPARSENRNPEPGMKGVQRAKATAPAYLNVKEFAAKGYSVVGPLSVDSFTREYLSLYTGKEDLKISLRGKRLILRSVKGGSSSTAIKKGTKVYVCRKDKEIRVYVLPHKEARNDQ